jgi:hypothetical protein
MPKRLPTDGAAKTRAKIAKPPKSVDPMADDTDGEPQRDSTQWHFWAYGKAYADGISRASQQPYTRPVVAGPKSIMVQLLRAHCKDEHGKTLRGPDVLEWLENVAHDFRSKANEREYGFGQHAWSPQAFSNWLNNGRPTMTLSRPGTAAARAHIAVKQG